MHVEAITWVGGPAGHARLIDQTRLPERLVHLEVTTAEGMRDAIGRLAVRGAPAIGVAAAFGLVLAARGFPAGEREDWLGRLREAAAFLASARPTAVNLSWALERLVRDAEAPERANLAPAERLARLHAEAQRIWREDRETCARLGEVGLALLKDGATVHTHCNAGALATAGMGTALAPVYAAKARGWKVRVVADETRPLLQGARLTAWELGQAGIDVTLITDGMAASVLRSGRVDLVLVGADRIAMNGDVANKVGTYPLALAAREHGVPFYVVAPLSTFDERAASGEAIPIEERGGDEITHLAGVATAAAGAGTYNPAFDVTPARLITGIVTEHGLVERPDAERVRALFERARAARR